MRNTFLGARSNYDGKYGDGSGREVCIHNYYDFRSAFCDGENYIIRIKPKTLRHKLPYYAKSLCLNDKIGYSQADRYSCLEELMNAGKFKDIKRPCNLDCSSLIMTVLWRMGYRGVNRYMTTYTMLDDFKRLSKQYGIKYTVIKFEKQKQLYKGDILLNTKHHVVIVG